MKEIAKEIIREQKSFIQTVGVLPNTIILDAERFDDLRDETAFLFEQQISKPPKFRGMDIVLSFHENELTVGLMKGMRENDS